MPDNPSVPAPLPIEPAGGLDHRFCEVMDAAPVLIWVSAQDKLCIWFNRPWLAFTGRTMDQEFGNGWAEGVHREDFDRCLEIYVTQFDARQPFRMQYRLRRHDGEYRWIDDIGTPRYANNGAFLGYIGSCIDIHDARRSEIELRALKESLETNLAERMAELRTQAAAREQSEEAAKQSELQFRTLVQGLKDHAIYMLDPNGRVRSWNSGAQRIKGYAAEEIIGEHFFRFYTDEAQREGLPMRALAQAARDGKHESEGWRVRKDGSRFWASVVIDPIADRAGEIIGFAKVTRDISEQHKAEEFMEAARDRLLQAQKMESIGQLTGGVAHDFNNLLTIIMGNLETAQRHIGSLSGGMSAQLGRLVGNAMRGAQRAATLTQRLLAFSRRQPLNPKTLDVNKFVVGISDFLQRSLGETIKVEAVGGAGLWQVEVDAGQLEAAMVNLAVNARDAMAEGGKLTIETSNAFLDQDYCRANPEVLPGQYALISVTDTGTGMTKEVQDRAFEPFFTTKVVGQGTGLGLSQVYGFVKQSGGHVKIYSEIGEGTTVKIYLPRITGEIHPEEAAPSERGHEGLDETILVVEDDADVRAYIVEVLHDLNYDVLEAADAASALALLERTGAEIDLLLSDVVLPEMNGRELAKVLLDRWPSLSVLFMTGYSRNAIVHQGRLDPGVEVIQKPITQADLASRVRDLLDAARIK
jgi:PAS domain S-box-containing protein